jgi:hypothetical protein
VSFAKANLLDLLLMPLPCSHDDVLTSPWRALAMAGMSRVAPLSAFSSPRCATQTVAKPTEVCVVVLEA